MRRRPAPIRPHPPSAADDGPLVTPASRDRFAVTPATTALTSSAPAITFFVLAWVWFGRCLVTGQEGWMVLLLAIWGWPVALLAFLPHVLGRLRRTTSGDRCPMNCAEVVAQVAAWVGLVVIGACIVEFGDVPDSGSSVLTHLAGLDPEAPIRATVLRAACVAVVVSWCAQLLLVGTPPHPTPPSPRATGDSPSGPGPNPGANDDGGGERRSFAPTASVTPGDAPSQVLLNGRHRPRPPRPARPRRRRGRHGGRTPSAR
ncbi:hypothetical protein [Mobilicoccus pelagius]|uniref:Uncharacterized protein n=1 Tax=Mobilicoccus pelagius NBRC 104925 TaxID=1089455 RepID=H5UW03_9MICO|nr:hypothetical protein [Mobilicoccus pelagius]GAB49911.1 hypothetical protein MOPEL_135_01490 [Mobilicoccus pelagius NBRC 104925]